MGRSLELVLGALAIAGCLCAEQPWWEREPLRIIDLITSMSQIDYRDPARIAQEKAALGYNAEHLEIMAMPAGLDDRGFFFKSNLASVAHGNYLGRYISEAKKRGIRVFIYFNVHYYTMRFAAEHRDWREIRENGKPLDGVYDTGASFCVNTPCTLSMAFFMMGPSIVLIPVIVVIAGRNSANATVRTCRPKADGRASRFSSFWNSKPTALLIFCAIPTPS